VNLRVLIVGTDLDRVEAELLAALADHGISIDLVIMPEAHFLDVFADRPIRVFPLAFHGRIDPIAILKLRRIVKGSDYRIIHFLSARAVSNGLISCWGLHLKRIAYRGTIGHVSRFDPAAWMSFLNPALDRIVCVSEAVRNFLASMLPADRLVTIYKGHDVAWYRRANIRQLEQFGIPSNSFVIACVANMRPVKGIPYLLEALKLIDRNLNVHLLLIGRTDTTVEKIVNQMAEFRDRVHAVGYLNESTYWVSQCDCFVLPSVDREGLPKALLEAMSVGVVPITTAVGGMPEVVEDGISGIVVPPRDAHAIAAAVVRLAREPDLKKRLAEAAYLAARDRFSIRGTVTQTLALYRELVHMQERS